MPKSRTAQLIEMKLERPLVEHVREQRADGASWHSIAVGLAQSTGVTVTPETLRIWLANEPGMERGQKTGVA